MAALGETASLHSGLTVCRSVSGHYKPASNGRNDPGTKICVSRHFSSKQVRIYSLMSGLFERKMPLFSQGLMRAPLAGSFRLLLAGSISTQPEIAPGLSGTERHQWRRESLTKFAPLTDEVEPICLVAQPKIPIVREVGRSAIRK